MAASGDRRSEAGGGAFGGPLGNERLTGATAAVLIALLAVEFATVLTLRTLLPLHIALGVALLPPVALKLASTGYRFVRYYLGTVEYTLRGAPPLLLRALGPVVVISTLTLFGSGVGLLVFGRRVGALRGLHAASFAVFGVAIGIHVLAHLRRLPGLALADRRRDGARVAGARPRALLVVASLALGLLLALVAIQFDGSLVHHHRDFGDVGHRG